MPYVFPISKDYWRSCPEPTLHDYQSEYAWERVKRYPVSPMGYRHINNKANEGVRAAEFAVWRAAAMGEHPAVISFEWHVHRSTLHRASIALDKLRKRPLK